MTLDWRDTWCFVCLQKIKYCNIKCYCRQHRTHSVLSLNLGFLSVSVVLLTRATFCIVLLCVICVCQYQCKWLTGKTRLRNDLWCVDGDLITSPAPYRYITETPGFQKIKTSTKSNQIKSNQVEIVRLHRVRNSPRRNGLQSSVKDGPCTIEVGGGDLEGDVAQPAQRAVWRLDDQTCELVVGLRFTVSIQQTHLGLSDHALSITIVIRECQSLQMRDNYYTFNFNSMNTFIMPPLLIGGGIKRWCCLTSVCRMHRA